ncbi:MAG: Fe-S cluster assembly protein SufB [Candidatus Doudnabacteria bacterium]|nr:Fe-S cluster assembly protein SufB [Candidatus Doudnabacteria bacterium]
MDFKGLTKETVEAISRAKDEPAWMLDLRLKAYEHFLQRPMPTWGADLSDLDFSDINYFVRATDKKSNSWDEVPTEIKDTFSRLGIPEAERKFLAGVATQYESEVVYESLQKKWNSLGVVFMDTDTGLKEYPEIFQKYFGKSIPYTDNKFAALNTAVWSGGSFIYVPKGVKVDIPLQAYFFIQSRNMGQFERTLIVADEGSEVHYIEGCTAPSYSTASLHSAVVELFALPGARIRYTTIQNWSSNVYNLVTKRGIADKDAIIEWIDCNLGSKVTMKYPSVILRGDNSHGEVLSIAKAEAGQHQDSGAKMIHIGRNTTSLINGKSICSNGGRTSYRGLVKINKGAKNAKAKVMCDALIFDDKSQTDTYPHNEIYEETATLEHEATVSKIGDDQLWYLMTRGVGAADASALIVSGFIEPIVRELPMEYALEMNELIRMEMEGSVG